MVGGGLAFTGSIIPADRGIKRAKHPGRVTADDDPRRHVLEDDCVNPDYGVPPDPDPRLNRDLAADPHVVLDYHRARNPRMPAVARRLRVGEMIQNLAGPEHTVRTHLDAIGSNDRAAVQPGIAADVNHGPWRGGDQTVHLRMRPGVDVGVEYHAPRSPDTEPAVAQQSWTDPNLPSGSVGEGGKPAEAARCGLFPVHYGDPKAAYDLLGLSRFREYRYTK